MPNFTLADAKQRLRIPDVWTHFGFAGEPKTSCRCPWRDDHKPSFSVSRDGLLWRDFATNEGGDAIDFLARASGLSSADACRKFVELAGGRHIDRSHKRDTAQRERPVFPPFERGSATDLQQLAKLRNIGLEGVQFASERGLLWFGTLRGFRAWIVTDGERVNAQARRLDGRCWEHLHGTPKSWTLPGAWAGWPIGVREAQPFGAIALCEGGPDFLAAHYLALWEQAADHANRNVNCAPVAMLGASQRIHAEALPLCARKIVRVFCHADDAGRAAADRWASQLQSVGADVDAFDFGGLRQANGESVKDLNDYLNADAASLADAEERILP